MFTGLVEQIGTVVEYKEVDTEDFNGVTAVISDCSGILVDAKLGDLISTNGVCLTVTELDEAKTWFKVGIAPETLRRTNLGDLKSGSKVNLERAVTADVRLGGHVVQGHVDTIATIVNRGTEGNALTFKFELRDKQYMQYIVEKGFISIDGTSLTITGVDYERSHFSIMMVSYTQLKVIMPMKKEGDTVNIEVDLTGKLIEGQIVAYLDQQVAQTDSRLAKLIESIIDRKLEERLGRV